MQLVSWEPAPHSAINIKRNVRQPYLKKLHNGEDSGVSKPLGQRVKPDWVYQPGRTDTFMTAMTLKAWHITLFYVTSVLHRSQVLTVAGRDNLLSDPGLRSDRRTQTRAAAI